MNNTNNQKEKTTLKWNLLEVLKGKTFSVLLSIFAAHFLLTTLTGMIGIQFIPVIYYVSSVIFGVLAAWIYQNRKNVNKMMVVGISLEELERREKKFKWHSLFGILIGYVLWISAIILMTQIEIHINIFVRLFIMIGFPVLFIIIYKPLNKMLVKITHTNEKLIQEFQQGWYNHILPEDCSSQADKYEIAKCLEKGEAHTVRGAMYVYRVKRCLKGVGKAGGVLGTIVGVFVLLLTLGMVNSFNKSVSGNMRDMF